VNRYAEPLAGVRPAEFLADTAARIRREYTECAHGEAISWTQIGQALTLDNSLPPKHHRSRAYELILTHWHGPLISNA
jgi:hypothetical protein